MGLHCKTVVSVVADPKMEYPTGQMRLLAKVLFRFADGIVFQTKEAMDFFPKAVRKKGVILPNSLNPQFIRERFEGEREKKIVAVGRLDDNKNHAMLLEAFAEIKEDFPDYRVVIYGEGEDRSKLEKLVAKRKLDGRVSLPGRTDKIEEKIYKSSLFVMTSDTEGLSLRRSEGVNYTGEKRLSRAREGYGGTKGATGLLSVPSGGNRRSGKRGGPYSGEYGAGQCKP